MIQPLLVAKETSAGFKTSMDLSGPSPSMCVCLTKCGCAFVCLCLPCMCTQQTVLKSQNNITVLPCVHETC